MTSDTEFLWGVATSAYQSEGGFNIPGGPRNNWGDAEDAGDVVRTGASSDFWNRWAEDFARCATLGLNTFRLGIAWARVEPAQGQIDFTALDQYVEMLESCRSHGMEPIVTLHHFTHPAWGGTDFWLRPDAAALFEGFAKLVVEYVNRHLMHPIRYWITINEPNMLVLNTYIGRQFPGNARIGFDTVVHAYNGLLAGHVHAYNAIHDLSELHGWPTPIVTLNNFCNDLYLTDKLVVDLLFLRERNIPRSKVGEYLRKKSDEFTRELRNAHLPLRKDLAYWCGALFKWVNLKISARWFHPEFMDPLLDAIYASPRKQLLDIIAFDYYDPFTAHAFRLPVFWDHEFKNKSFRSWVINTVTSKWWDWRALPAGLGFFCELYARDYDRPILIAENGMALRRNVSNLHTPRRDGLTRSEFLRIHLEELQRVVKKGVRVVGYLHWSLFDNYEWGTFTPRFGLFSIDYKKGTERVAQDHLGDRPSETYAEIIRAWRKEEKKP